MTMLVRPNTADVINQSRRDGAAPAPGQSGARLFRAGAIEYDEARASLRVAGERRPLEAKPLALLHALLRQGGAVAGKQALIEAVWGNADHTSTASLANAISKIRAVLGENGRTLIEAVHGSGYRINAPVEVSVAARIDRCGASLVAGDTVPGRPMWRLERPAAAGQPARTWLARHDETGIVRVYKFSDLPEGRALLRLQAQASAALLRVLGSRPDLALVQDRQLDRPPCFIATAQHGTDLAAWAEAKGGLAVLALESRLAVLIQIAGALAAAHSAGVLHDGLKPANVLVADGPDGAPCVRVVDFAGTAPLPAPSCPDDAPGDGVAIRHAAPPYAAPEQAGAPAATIASDVYGLGVLLYQLVVCDLSRSLAIGWENDVADPLLRQDIAATCAGDPSRRLASASELATRLATLPARRQDARERREAQLASARLRARIERDRLRRPWIAAAACSLVLGASLAVGFGIRALHDRDEARRRAELAQSVNAFLTVDLLGRGDPALSGKPEETLMQAAAAAEAQIDRRLAREPAEAGAIYLSLARAYDSRSAYDAARRAYGRAAGWFDRAPDADAAVIARLQLAMMETTSGQPKSLDRARALVALERPAAAALTRRKREALVWQHQAEAALDLVAGDAHAAQAAFTLAADDADAMPDVFDEGSRLVLRRQVASTYIRLADWARARALLEQVRPRQLLLGGPRHPETLRTELDLAELDVAQGNAQAGLAALDRLYAAVAAVFGPDHRMTLTVLATRADALTQLGRYDEVQAAEMSIYHTVAAKEGLQSWAALGTLTNAAVAQCRAGRVVSGIETARRAYDGARAAFGPDHVLTQAAAANAGFCLVVADQPQEAARLLSRVDATAVSQTTNNPTFAAELDLMRAAIAFSAGDRTAGVALLRRAAKGMRRRDADRYMRAWMEALMKKQGVEL